MAMVCDVAAARVGVPPRAPGLPPPGPDFLAEADRLLPPATEDFAARGEDVVRAVRDGMDPPVDLGPAWVKQALSKNVKQQELAARKAAKWLEALYQGRRAGDVDAALEDLYRQALYSPGFVLHVASGPRVVPVQFVTGHLLSEQTPTGPQPADVMVVGKMPTVDEARRRRNFVGPSFVAWEEFLALLDPTTGLYPGGWYATSAVKFPRPEHASETIPVAWKKDCAPILHAEIRLVRPRIILCLGKEAAEMTLGEKVSVSDSRNRIYERDVPAARDGDEAYRAQVVVVPHPGVVFHDPGQAEDVGAALADFVTVCVEGKPRPPRIARRRLVNIYTEEHLARVVDRLVAAGDSTLAIDCEFEGEHWEEDAWLRTIQFAPAADEAYVVVLRGRGGVPAFMPDEAAARRHLVRLFKSSESRKVRVGGHFFRADIPWLLRFGIDVRPEFAPPATAEETKVAGGFDTAYMLHSVYETGRPFGLKSWTQRLLGAPRYDEPLWEWIEADRKARKAKKGDRRGFGDVPDVYLLGDEMQGIPNYAAMDAAVTRELFDVLNGEGDVPGLLDCDSFGLNSRGAYLSSQRASLAFLEIEMEGMLLDRDRVDVLADTFDAARAAKREELRARIDWPEFNPDSAPQVRELLFGEAFNGKGRRLRPPEARTLGLTPVKTTGDRAVMWEDVEDDQELVEGMNWAADKEVLGILEAGSEEVALLLGVRFLGQVLKFPIRMYERDDAGAKVRDALGRSVYKGGIASFQAADGRVRTRVYPVETGRCSTSKPPMQNFSSRREDEYKRLLGEAYPFPIRSIFRATPGHVIVKSDIKSAELVVVARLARDKAMLEDVLRGMLPEDDPNFRDMHSAKAIEAFQLDTPENRAILEAAGLPWRASKATLSKLNCKSLRVAAKNQLFGWLYGRGVIALCRQCLEEKAHVTEEQMQRLVDATEAKYVTVVAYLNAAARRAGVERFITNPFGRHRRAGATRDRGKLGEIERQFRNFNVQSTVADFVSNAMHRLYEFRAGYTGPHSFRFILQVHDELDFEVPIPSVRWFIEEVLPIVRTIAVPVADFEGRPIPGLPPFHLDLDTTIYEHWGLGLSAERALELGLDPALVGDD